MTLPMLPPIATSTQFSCCSDFEAAQMARNNDVVAALEPAMQCWNSLVAETIRQVHVAFEPFDQRALLDLSAVLAVVKPLELATSVHGQFTTAEAVAVIRVLKHVPSDAGVIE